MVALKDDGRKNYFFFLIVFVRTCNISSCDIKFVDLFCVADSVTARLIDRQND